jgi:hypothetical protein
VAFGLAAIIAFSALMYFLLWRENAALAGVAASLFIVSALLVFLPELESLKAFGVEAKLRARLSEADELLAKLRSLATVNAQLAYQQLAWMGRWASPRAAMKQQLASEVDRVVKELGLDAQIVAAPKQEYIRHTLKDLSRPFSQLVSMRAKRLAHDLWLRHKSSPDFETYKKKISGLQELAQEVAVGLHGDERFDAFVERCLPNGLFPSDDESRMRAFGRCLAAMADAAQTTGQVPTEMAALLDDVEGASVRRYRDIFGEEPGSF